MSRDNSAVFGRGETFYAGRTIDTANLEAVELEGLEKEFEDLNWGDQFAKSARTERRVLCRIYRNMTTVALLGKRMALAGTTPTTVYRATGYTNAVAPARPIVVDEFLPAAGVPYGDLFWGVVRGPAIIKSSAAAFIAIAAGDVVVGATGAAASTGATAAATTGDAGKIEKQDLSGATALLGAQIQNAIGIALTAATTAETNKDVLVDVKLRW